MRESVAIEQDAHLVALLYKLTGGNDDAPGKACLEQDAALVNWLITRRRDGPAGDVALSFLRAHRRFESGQKTAPRRLARMTGQVE